MFEFLKKKKESKRWRLFASYVDPFMRSSVLAMQLISKANELGLQGKKLDVMIRENSMDQGLDEIWFEGDM